MYVPPNLTNSTNKQRRKFLHLPLILACHVAKMANWKTSDVQGMVAPLLSRIHQR